MVGYIKRSTEKQTSCWMRCGIKLGPKIKAIYPLFVRLGRRGKNHFKRRRSTLDIVMGLCC